MLRPQERRSPCRGSGTAAAAGGAATAQAAFSGIDFVQTGLDRRLA